MHDCTELPEVPRGIKLILNLCLSDGFDTFPTLLCADGCSMIDRRMGIYGYPIEIQALFFFALRCSKQLLKPEHDGKKLIELIDKRITALCHHIQNYYWLDSYHNYRITS
ncbi:Alkaline/neutral invertase cinv2 [Castilleja foliolosa]|uniref:Alkaline/neutral invertase cinv2 n=1 Tax=Castilleja foliolosa TaxID=1961234 RepID=A0ABD3BXP4_9LAMI